MDRLCIDMQLVTIYGDFNKYNQSLEQYKKVNMICNKEIAYIVDEYPDRIIVSESFPCRTA